MMTLPAAHSGKETLMRLRTLLLIGGLLALVFGICFLIAPQAMLRLYGIAPDPAITLMSRFFAAALLQIGLVLYLIRDVGDPRTQRGVVLGSFIGSLAGLVVALTGQFWGLVNGLGWSTVAIYAFLLVGYGFFIFGKPRTI
jgi:membrane-bound ClpP family serine protease